jgi:alpha-galactosidase
MWYCGYENKKMEGKFMLSRRNRKVYTRILPVTIIMMLLTLLALVNPIGVSAQNNGAARTPMMGWSSWSFMRDTPTETKIKAQADQVASKLLSHGYQYVNLDDYYYLDPNTTVDSYGRWVVDSTSFPNGMAALGSYIHGKGLKFGMYVTPGIPAAAVSQNTPIQGTSYHARDIADTTRHEINYNAHYNSSTAMYYIDYSKPGAQEFINSWANLLASYGVDFIKIDGVGTWDIPDVQAWSSALNQTGRTICFDLSNGLDRNHASTWQQ